jgi:hypothetical protein
VVHGDERKQTADEKSKLNQMVSEPGFGNRSGISMGGVLKPGPCGIRLEGSVNLNQALGRNGRTCRLAAKGEGQVVNPMRLRVPTRGTGTERLVVGKKAL